MKYLHTMVRVSDLAQSLAFYCDALGLRELRRHDNESGRYTLVFLAAPGDDDAQIELTHNWDPEAYGIGRAFDTSRTRSTTSTPPASGSWITASRLTGRRATAAWRSFALRTPSRSSCCRRARRCRRGNRGRRCRTSEPGDCSRATRGGGNRAGSGRFRIARRRSAVRARVRRRIAHVRTQRPAGRARAAAGRWLRRS